MSKKVLIQKMQPGKYLVAIKADEPVGTLDLMAFSVTAYRVGVGELVYFIKREGEPEKLLTVHQVEVIEKGFPKTPKVALWFSTIRAHVAAPLKDKIF